jgi:hypothetical protein
MRNKFIMLGFILSFVVAALPQASFAADPAAQKPPTTADEVAKMPVSATFEAEGKQVRLLLGGSSGSGVLKFQGKDYPFTAKGVSLGGVGVNEVHVVGEVRNLKKVEDFAGTYNGIGMGATVVKGKGSSAFQNGKGVLINTKSKSDGLALTLGLSSVTITLGK